MTLPIEREAILPRIDGIKKNIVRLRELGALPFDQFKSGDPFNLAQHHLRLALEGVFHIGAHILSRLPGGRAVEYREIAEKLGVLNIVPVEFSKKKLVPMAGLRNILVHHYANLDAKRLHNVLRSHLGDIETYLGYIRTVLEAPRKFGLTVS